MWWLVNVVICFDSDQAELFFFLDMCEHDINDTHIHETWTPLPFKDTQSA